jgi:hypothetical protein
MSRHTFAVRLLEEGVDIYTVSKLLGHADIETTMAYAKATEGMKRKAEIIPYSPTCADSATPLPGSVLVPVLTVTPSIIIEAVIVPLAPAFVAER